jgi:hypothetical protein
MRQVFPPLQASECASAESISYREEYEEAGLATELQGPMQDANMGPLSKSYANFQGDNGALNQAWVPLSGTIRVAYL